MPRRTVATRGGRHGGWPSVLAAVAAAAIPLGTAPACTIGVAAGRATEDGRPLLWKVRDQGAYPDNHVIWNDTPGSLYRFVAVSNVGDTLAWMGVNEAGFAIVNSNSSDLAGRGEFGNGSLMHHALGHCATVADFTRLLDSTSVSGMRDVHACYGVIDAAGAAWMFEVEDSLFWEYDADEGNENPEGFIVRTNFSMAGGGTNGMARYLRSRALIGQFCAGDSLTHRSLLRYHARDFSDESSQPVPVPYAGQWNPSVPYGYIWTYLSICRAGSVSGVVIRGVEPGQAPWQTTMWTLLGQPASTVAVPVWPAGDPPLVMAGAPTAPLCDAANMIRTLLFDCPYSDYIDSYKLRTASGNGLWRLTFAVEDSLFAAVERADLAWRRPHALGPDPVELASRLAEQAVLGLQNAYAYLSLAEPIADLRVQRADDGILVTWEPVTTSMATTTLAVADYEILCAATPDAGGPPFARFVTAEPRCVIPWAESGGFFCRVTSRCRGVATAGPWLWVFPLSR